MGKQTFRDDISAILGCEVTSAIPLQGGMIAEVYRVDLADGRCIAAKVSSGEGTLDIEGYMLNYLAAHSNLPVPDVLHSTPNLLLMAFVEGNSELTEPVKTNMAELLGELHTNARSDSFGMERDTLIGPLHQPNPQSKSWIDFFREHRLLYMAEGTHKEGALPTSVMKRIETLAARLDRYLEEPEYPSLIHGDIWATNVLARNGKVTALIDPAIYYAHPEIELAYTTLFGTLGPAFFNRYQEIRPISPGFFEERRDIYNLYPLLVHVRLFGGSYLHYINSILNKFGV